MTTSPDVPLAPAPIPCLPQELVASPAFLLMRLGFQVKARSIDEFEEAGFSPYHYSVLALLDEGVRETQATIADALQLDRSQLVGLLDGLEERGLIERRRDSVDRRRHAVSLTPAGSAALVQMRSIVKNVQDEFLAPLDPESRAALHTLLLRVASHHDARFLPAAATG